MVNVYEDGAFEGNTLENWSIDIEAKCRGMY